MAADLCLIALIWFAGGLVNGIAGFGAALVAMPLTAPFVDISAAVPACILIVLILNCQVVWTFRKDFRWTHVKEICMGAIPGVMVSSAVLEFASESHLKAGMGAFLTGYALWGLCFKKESGPRRVRRVWGYLAGAFSAALGMAFGFNGPPLAAYTAYSGLPARIAKGMLGAGLLITGSCILAAKAGAGQIGQAAVIVFLAAAPGVLLGSKLGIALSSRIKEAVYRKVLYVSLTVMGLQILVASLP